MPGLTTFFQTTFVHLGPLGVFLGSFVGEVVGPVPAVSIIAGAVFSVARHAQFSAKLVGDILILIALPDAFGATLGSFVTYGIGYWGGKPVITRWGKYFNITWEKVEKIQKKLFSTQKDELFLFFARALPLLPNVAINMVCGLMRMPQGRYALITFWGTFVRATIYAFLGWYLGGAYKKYAHLATKFERWLFVAVLLGLVMYALLRIYKNKKKKFDTI